MNQVSGFGAEVGEAGNRIVENISDGYNRFRNERENLGRGEREEGDRSVSTNQSALLSHLINKNRAFINYRFWGGRCVLNSQCAYLTLGNTNLQVSACDNSYIQGDFINLSL